ncbi:MAG: ATP-binding protein [Brevundimonas sp.]
MTLLSDIVRVDGRFQRSARIDADLKGFPPLEGYVLQASVQKALDGMVATIAEGGRSAFTWTGPYGGGKSSAALLVGSLVAGDCDARQLARTLAGQSLTHAFEKAFPETNGAWSVVAVTGRRASLRDEIALAAGDALRWSKADIAAAAKDDRTLVDRLAKSAAAQGGVLLIIDELGKLLEYAVSDGGDVHLLQDLAERGDRSGGRLVTIGVLHQSFAQYAARAGRDVRDEWAKIQGRFKDVPFLSATDETVSLLGRAIRSEGGESDQGLAQAIAEAIALRRPVDADALTKALHDVWPLHPITALLLGPLSRQRFAQNERSVFGFLSSAEPKGFQEHLATTNAESVSTLFGPDLLWDYLIANFGVALTDGADGRRFSLALEAIERAAVRGGELHTRLIKTIALMEFFRNGSGLAAADDILTLATPDADAAVVKTALSELVEWAILIRQPRLGGYALFAGSDFDLEEAIERARGPLDRDTVAGLPVRVGFSAIPAKRHYFDTGALRSFEPRLLLVGESEIGKGADLSRLINEIKRGGAGHRLVLVMSDGSASTTEVESVASTLAKRLWDDEVVAAVGAATSAVSLRTSAAELVAIDTLARDHPQLEGDRIARREMAARRSALFDEVHRQIVAAFEAARWKFGPAPHKALGKQSLSSLVSAVSDAAYRAAPKLHSELLQRERPSSSAMAAVRDLGHAMVLQADAANLNIEGYPAHRGLYMTVLAPFGLHRRLETGWRFTDPDVETAIGRSLVAAWEVVGKFPDVSLDVIFDVWAKPPYGLKRGVMPILALAYILAKRSALAVYVSDIFQPGVEPLLFDRILQSPAEIRIKHIDRTRDDTKVLTILGKGLGLKAGASSLDVAAGLYQRFEALPMYSKRTLRLPAEVRNVRDLVLKAHDPEALLFRDLKPIVSKDPSIALRALETCEGAYAILCSDLVRSLRSTLAAPDDFADLGARASNVVDRTGDLRFDAFANRAAAFESGKGDIEGLASLLVHKPAHSWTDREHDQALMELSRLGKLFRETEAVVAVRDRRKGGEALAVVVGLDPDMPPLIKTFEVTAAESLQADDLASQLMSLLGKGTRTDTVNLAALARAVQRLNQLQEVEAL